MNRSVPTKQGKDELVSLNPNFMARSPEIR